MKIEFKELTWRSHSDYETFMEDVGVCVEVDHIELDVTHCVCTVNNVIFPYYKCEHGNSGLERTSIFYTNAKGCENEIAIFSSGIVAIIHHNTFAPEFAIHRANTFDISELPQVEELI